MDDLRISDALTIPGAELLERFDTSGGPGGQHANRSATKVTLSFDVAASPTLSDQQRRRLVVRLGGRLRNGVVAVAVDESRSQWRNRQLARSRLAGLLADNLGPPQARRVPTKPSQASRQRRLDEKKARGRVKRLRRRPDVD